MRPAITCPIHCIVVPGTQSESVSAVCFIESRCLTRCKGEKY